MMAPTNGFITAQITCKDGERGVAVVKVVKPNGESKTFKVSAHHFGPSDAWIRYNCITIPVQQGDNATAELGDEDKNGDPKVEFTFTSFT